MYREVIFLTSLTSLCLSQSFDPSASLNLSSFLEVSHPIAVSQFAQTIYKRGVTKGKINENIGKWVERQSESVQKEFSRFMEERKYSLVIANYDLTTTKMKIKKCFPKILKITEIEDIMLWEKNRRLNIEYAKCGRVASKLIRKFLFEYGLEYSPFDVYRIGNPDLEAQFMQWPTVTMPERIAFMNIIARNITQREMKDEINRWARRLTPSVKKLFDFYHTNHTKFAEIGKVKVMESIEKIYNLIDQIAEIKRNENITLEQQNNQVARLLSPLDKRTLYLLKEVAWNDLRRIDEHPLIKYGVPRRLAQVREIRSITE